ncbi:GGDEF domain-containing phosphodiesterase [Granulicella sp. dw_53]|uniref:putative bifunctional diguanylate cyclase/phosphodiesterase n=1 Tax=Granulicella sp. dw_53 TaxID=2719792 RepID=UPI0021077C35|nr:GGDEF domain-containing phosphodiesterase [Granulicella sp. dw_53]
MPPKRSRQEQARVRKTSHITPILVASNPLPMWIYDVESLRFLEVNEHATHLYGYTQEEFLSLTVNDLFPESDLSKAEHGPYTKLIDIEQKTVSTTKDGTLIPVKLHVSELRYRGKQARYVVVEDVTEMHSVQELVRLAHHDDLTGLPNRILLKQRMAESFNAAKKNGRRAGLICLDLDRFKQINDWYGHAIGDECLKEVGSTLVRRMRGMDTVARTGGEEFTLVLAEVESVEAAEVVAKALLQIFSSPLEVEGHSISLSASIGMSVFPDHGTDDSVLWRSADAAMYRAKRAGGNRHAMAASITTVMSENIGIENHMRENLSSGGFHLQYQTQYFMSGQIRGMEALIRLPHGSLGFVSPDRFIPLAEENGLIHNIGKWVIQEACRQLMIWNRDREVPVCIAVNVSPLQLMRDDFADEVREAILEFGIDPTWLEMEITERAILNFDEIAKRMISLANLGIRFAIDDFGTGYSSLQHLQRLPVSTLKIDRSFIQRLSESSRSYSIVKAIIAMGHSLQMQIVSEGVEVEDQMRVLRKLHCDSVQGFLLSRPVDPEAISL